MCSAVVVAGVSCVYAVAVAGVSCVYAVAVAGVSCVYVVAVAGVSCVGGVGGPACSARIFVQGALRRGTLFHGVVRLHRPGQDATRLRSPLSPTAGGAYSRWISSGQRSTEGS